MAEVIVLPVGIPGVGRKGDYIVSDPDHPNPKCRLARFGVLEPELLRIIKQRTTHPSHRETTHVTHPLQRETNYSIQPPQNETNYAMHAPQIEKSATGG